MKFHIYHNIDITRMALDIVEGYVIDTNKPWCAVYARYVK